MFQLQGYHTTQSLRESLCQGTGKENSADSRTSDSGGTVRFSSRSWHTGPALYPFQGAGGCMGVWFAKICAASAVMRSMYRSVVMKKEVSCKAKLSIYRSIYILTLTYGHELWVAILCFSAPLSSSLGQGRGWKISPGKSTAVRRSCVPPPLYRH